MRFYRVVASLATVTILLLVACGGTSTVPAQPAPTATAQPSPTPLLTPVAIANVKIVTKNGQNAFDPAMLTVKVGTQVVWTNDTNVPHTVTSDTGVFDTPPDYLQPHQTFKVIFTKPGTYTYYCNFHLYMKGAIIVIVPKSRAFSDTRLKELPAGRKAAVRGMITPLDVRSSPKLCGSALRVSES